MRALVLDSNVSDCASLGEHLRQAGYVPILADSVHRVRRVIDREQFDVLLLGSTFPDSDGLLLCNEIRERLGKSIVIICITDSSSPSRQVVALDLGADDVVGKPFDPEELLARIEAHLRRSGADKHFGNDTDFCN